MAMEIKDVRSTLNNLIETCKDGQQGFLDAAHEVRDTSIKSLFLELSQQRSKFAGELQQEVMRAGGDPEMSGSTAGALHRGWIDFKAKFTGQSDAAVVSEAERGEDIAVKAYEKAQNEELPGDVRDIVMRQYKEVLKAHAKVRALEVRTNSGAA